MTDRRLAATPTAGSAAPRRRPPFWPTAAAALACFAVVFVLLAFQLRAGNDPALGAPLVTAAKQSRPVVINRRVIRTRVVHDPALTASGSASAGSTPVQAPIPAAPPVAAPAPAPAPAPVVTSTS